MILLLPALVVVGAALLMLRRTIRQHPENWAAIVRAWRGEE